MKFSLEKLKEYVQKSRFFVMPLLSIPNEPKVIETYFGIKGLELCKGYALVMLYHNRNTKYKALLKKLNQNKFFDFVIEDDEFDIVIFDLSSIKEDYDKILNGQYSKLSKTAKILIKINNPDERASMGINPEYYYKEIADLLQYPEDCFENKELISLPDLDNEMLHVNEKIFNELTNEYKIPLSTTYS